MVLLRAIQWCNQILILKLRDEVMAFLDLRLLLHVLMSFFCLYLMKLHSGTNFLQKEKSDLSILPKKGMPLRPAA